MCWANSARRGGRRRSRWPINAGCWRSTALDEPAGRSGRRSLIVSTGKPERPERRTTQPQAAGVVQDGPMPGRDGIQDAVWELYGTEPEEFLRRRAGLAAAARKAGDRDAAKQIAGLRKPTRAAYLINRLARTDPDRVGSLLDLGVELRRAERSVDAAQLRELTARRRRLVEDLAGRVFDIAGADSPTASIRDEVVSTLNAALADDAVAEHVRAGTLVRGAQWAGFGFGSVPDLTVVPTPADGPQPTKPAPVTGVSRRTRTAGQAADQADAQSKADAVAQA